MTTQHLTPPAAPRDELASRGIGRRPGRAARRHRRALGDRLAAVATTGMLAAGGLSALTTHGAPARAGAYAVLGLMAARLAWLMRPAMARRPGAPYLVLPGILTVLLLLACGFAEHALWVGAALLLAPVVAVHAGVRGAGGRTSARRSRRGSVGPAEHS